MGDNTIFQQDLVYFQMNMLRAYAEIQGMIWENENAKQNGNTVPYTERAFNKVLEKNGVYHNAFPFYKGE